MNKQVNQYKKFDKFEGEIIKTIKIDIRIDDIVVTDQFEWDINNPSNNPEAFSKTLCADLGLGSEFILPIAHSIKEQILDHQKVKQNSLKLKIIRLLQMKKNYIIKCFTIILRIVKITRKLILTQL